MFFPGSKHETRLSGRGTLNSFSTPYMRLDFFITFPSGFDMFWSWFSGGRNRGRKFGAHFSDATSLPRGFKVAAQGEAGWNQTAVKMPSVTPLAGFIFISTWNDSEISWNNKEWYRIIIMDAPSWLICLGLKAPAVQASAQNRLKMSIL